MKAKHAPALILLILLVALSNPFLYAQTKSYQRPESEILQTKVDAPPTERLSVLNASLSQMSQLNGQFQVYIKPESAPYIMVTDFEHAGATWEDCSKSPQKCVAWPDANSQITRLPYSEPKKIKTGVDPVTGEPIFDTFIHVRVQYNRDFLSSKCEGLKTDERGQCLKTLQQDKEGWINTRYLSETPVRPLYSVEPSVQPTPITKKKPDDCEIAPTKKNQSQLGDIARAIETNHLQNIKQKADELAKVIGKCPIKPPDNKTPHQASWRRKNIYDKEVMPELQKMKNQVPRINRQDGTPMNWNDLVNIDALARTIYSEMNECFKDGVEFPMAAARVALNRVADVNRGVNQTVFLKSWFHNEEKPTLAKVLTADRQFSVWNYMSAPQDKTILMSLCPSSPINANNNWKGGPSSRAEQAIWNQAMQIATEAVLHPNDFLERTKDVRQRYYTSKMANYANRSRPRPPPTIGGRQVESFKCMYLWNGK